MAGTAHAARLPFAKWAPPPDQSYFPAAIGTSSESEVIA